MATKDIKQNSLVKALSHCSLRELPEKDNGERFWVTALALVRKSDGSESYVYSVKSQDLTNRITVDFGNISSIREIVEYYPITYLNSAYVPKFKTAKKEERITYLSRYVKNVAMLEEKTTKELDKLIVAIAVKRQLNEK